MEASKVKIASYDSSWPRLFDEERRLLEPVLEPWLVDGVHHIGSTAVPGLPAKPVIDMIAGVRDLEVSRAAYQPLYEVGYVHAPHRPHEAHHFAKPSANWWEITHNLHLTEAGSALWRERFAFRDALRADPALADEYAALKQRLADGLTDESDVRRDYTARKRDFIVRILASAGISLAAQSPRKS